MPHLSFLGVSSTAISSNLCLVHFIPSTSTGQKTELKYHWYQTTKKGHSSREIEEQRNTFIRPESIAFQISFQPITHTFASSQHHR
jgi:hypothetical protein